jgi:hypothetical protein
MRQPDEYVAPDRFCSLHPRSLFLLVNCSLGAAGCGRTPPSADRRPSTKPPPRIPANFPSFSRQFPANFSVWAGRLLRLSAAASGFISCFASSRATNCTLALPCSLHAVCQACSWQTCLLTPGMPSGRLADPWLSVWLACCLTSGWPLAVLHLTGLLAPGMLAGRLAPDRLACWPLAGLLLPCSLLAAPDRPAPDMLSDRLASDRLAPGRLAPCCLAPGWLSCLRLAGLLLACWHACW